METAATEGLSVLFQYGILGVVCVFLMLAVYYLMKRADNRDERFMEVTEKFNDTVKTFAINEGKQTILMNDLKDLIISLKK